MTEARYVSRPTTTLVLVTLAVLVAGLLLAIIRPLAAAPTSRARAGVDSLLCVDPATEDVQGVEFTTPEVCIPFV